MPFLEPLPHLTRPLGEDRAYKLVGGLRHTDGDVVPSGRRTDLASTPRALHWLTPPSGPYEAAAVRHDEGCNLLNARQPGRDSRTVDRDFRTDLRDLGMGVCRRWLMWLGVRLGALVSATRRPGSLPTLPGVAALLVLSCWLVIPTLICQLAVTVLDVVEPAPPRRPHPAQRDDTPSGHHELVAAA
jgi:hypothetical protein